MSYPRPRCSVISPVQHRNPEKPEQANKPYDIRTLLCCSSYSLLSPATHNRWFTVLNAVNLKERPQTLNSLALFLQFDTGNFIQCTRVACLRCGTNQQPHELWQNIMPRERRRHSCLLLPGILNVPFISVQASVTRLFYRAEKVGGFCPRMSRNSGALQSIIVIIWISVVKWCGDKTNSLSRDARPMLVWEEWWKFPYQEQWTVRLTGVGNTGIP